MKNVNGGSELLDNGQGSYEPPTVSFIPKRLEIPGRPELDVFPCNILFVTFGAVLSTGVPRIVAYRALYEPDLGSYVERDTGDGPVASIVYWNTVSDDKVVIEYNTKDFWYKGRKEVKGEEVGSVIGKDWKGFFVHLGLLGVKEGERCWKERVQ